MEVEVEEQSVEGKRFSLWSNKGLEDTIDNSSWFVKAWNLIVDATEASRSLFVRLLFGAHLAFVIAALRTFICIDSVWLLMFLFLLVLIEYIVSIVWEYPFTWLQPCVVVHLLVICPLIWCMEIGLHDPTWFSITFDAVPNCTITTELEKYFLSLISTRQKALQFLVRSLEQMLLLVLITSRWILPARHARHRSRVSQLLLMQIGRAADMSDIVDLFDIMPKNTNILDSAARKAARRQATFGSLESEFFILMLSLWQLSLFQFAIDFTVRQKPKKSQTESFKNLRDVIDYCLQTEIWGLVLNLVVQDCPFFLCRLYLMFGLQVYQEDIVFFMFNNAFIILLSLYRIYNIFEERRKSVVEDALRNATGMFKVNAKQRLFQRFKFKSIRIRRRDSSTSDDLTASNDENRSLKVPRVTRKKSDCDSTHGSENGLENDKEKEKEKKNAGESDADRQNVQASRGENCGRKLSAISVLVIEPEIIAENVVAETSAKPSAESNLNARNYSRKTLH